MGLELVIFIGAILFGIFIYWRESNGNKLYRFINKIFNSKALQMKPDNKKGFVYKQAFLPRLVYVVSLFLVFGLILQFLTPFKIFMSYNGISAFASMTFGTLIGTYLANFILKSGKVIEEKSDSLENMVSDTIEKGKDFIEDIKTKNDTETEQNQSEVTERSRSEDKKSARERLKDKGLL